MSTKDAIEPIENPDAPTIQEYLRVAGLNHTTNTVNNIRSQVVRRSCASRMRDGPLERRI